MVNITNYKLCFRTDDEGNKILNASNCFKLDFEREIDIQRQETLNFKRLQLSQKVSNGKGLVPLFTEDSFAVNSLIWEVYTETRQTEPEPSGKTDLSPIL